MQILSDLISIESEQHLWDYAISDNPVWPLIRNEVFEKKIANTLNYSNPHFSGSISMAVNPIFFTQFSKTAAFFLKNPPKKYDSLFFTTARNRVLYQGNEAYDDKMYDPFIQKYHSPLIFEESYQYMINYPRTNESNVFLFDYMNLMLFIHSKIRNKFKKNNDLNSFIGTICDTFDLPQYYHFFLNKASFGLNVQNYLEKYLSIVLGRLRGNIAYIHMASYLGIKGEICRILNENNIITVEMQHGFVGKEHFAYNYPSDRKVKNYLPKYFLTYGEFWNKNIRTSSQLSVIGHPDIYQMRDELMKKIIQKNKYILIISQGTVTERMVKIAKFLATNLKDHSIIFKLHPGEIPFSERYQELMTIPNIYVKYDEDIYELIALCETIIGFTSTAIYQAVVFEGKRIFILRNDFVPDFMGYKFSTCEELLNSLINPENGLPQINPYNIWDPNWEQNFDKFLTKLKNSN